MQGNSLVARGVAGLVGAMVLWPVGIAYGGPEDGPPVPRGTTCADVLADDEGWELEQTTDPADGSEVHAGDDIAVLMTWDATDFADRPLLNTFDCVSVDGELDSGLSVVEDSPPNDGEFTHNFTIPDGLPAGAAVCSRGAVVGDGNGYFELNPSNDVCFTVAQPAAPAEVCAPGSSEGTPPAPPDACAPASAAAPAPPPGEPSAGAIPPVVAGATEERPALAAGPATEVAPIPGVTLPATGNPARTIAVPAGALMALGGAAVIGAVKRPASFRARARRRRA